MTNLLVLWFSHRQFDDEGGADGGGGIGIDAAPVLLDDAVADGEPQADAPTHLFGGKERIKDPRQMVGGDAGTGVADPDFHGALGILTGADREHAMASHGLAGIHKKVEKDLFQFAFIPLDRGQVGSQIFLETDILKIQMVFHQSQQFGHQGIDINRLQAGRELPGEIQQAFNNLLATGGLPDDFFHLVTFRVIRGQISSIR